MFNNFELHRTTFYKCENYAKIFYELEPEQYEPIQNLSNITSYMKAYESTKIILGDCIDLSNIEHQNYLLLGLAAQQENHQEWTQYLPEDRLKIGQLVSLIRHADNAALETAIFDAKITGFGVQATGLLSSLIPGLAPAKAFGLAIGLTTIQEWQNFHIDELNGRLHKGLTFEESLALFNHCSSEIDFNIPFADMHPHARHFLMERAGQYQEQQSQNNVSKEPTTCNETPTLGSMNATQQNRNTNGNPVQASDELNYDEVHSLFGALCTEDHIQDIIQLPLSTAALEYVAEIYANNISDQSAHKPALKSAVINFYKKFHEKVNVIENQIQHSVVFQTLLNGACTVAQFALALQRDKQENSQVKQHIDEIKHRCRQWKEKYHFDIEMREIQTLAEESHSMANLQFKSLEFFCLRAQQKISNTEKEKFYRKYRELVGKYQDRKNSYNQQAEHYMDSIKKLETKQEYYLAKLDKFRRKTHSTHGYLINSFSTLLPPPVSTVLNLFSGFMSDANSKRNQKRLYKYQTALEQYQHYISNFDQLYQQSNYNYNHYNGLVFQQQQYLIQNGKDSLTPEDYRKELANSINDLNQENKEFDNSVVKNNEELTKILNEENEIKKNLSKNKKKNEKAEKRLEEINIRKEQLALENKEYNEKIEDNTKSTTDLNEILSEEEKMALHKDWHTNYMKSIQRPNFDHLPQAERDKYNHFYNLVILFDSQYKEYLDAKAVLRTPIANTLGSFSELGSILSRIDNATGQRYQALHYGALGITVGSASLTHAFRLITSLENLTYSISAYYNTSQEHSLANDLLTLLKKISPKLTEIATRLGEVLPILNLAAIGTALIVATQVVIPVVSICSTFLEMGLLLYNLVNPVADPTLTAIKDSQKVLLDFLTMKFNELDRKLDKGLVQISKKLNHLEVWLVDIHHLVFNLPQRVELIIKNEQSYQRINTFISEVESKIKTIKENKETIFYSHLVSANSMQFKSVEAIEAYIGYLDTIMNNSCSAFEKGNVLSSDLSQNSELLYHHVPYFIGYLAHYLQFKETQLANLPIFFLTSHIVTVLLEKAMLHYTNNGYSLHLMPESSVLEMNRIYVKIEQDKLQYKVIAPSGKLQGGKISTKELKHSLNDSLTLEKLKPLLPDILKITSKRGHTLNNKSPLAFRLIRSPLIKNYLCRMEERAERLWQFLMYLKTNQAWFLDILETYCNLLRATNHIASKHYLAKIDDRRQAPDPAILQEIFDSQAQKYIMDVELPPNSKVFIPVFFKHQREVNTDNNSISSKFRSFFETPLAQKINNSSYLKISSYFGFPSIANQDKTFVGKNYRKLLPQKKQEFQLVWRNGTIFFYYDKPKIIFVEDYMAASHINGRLLNTLPCFKDTSIPAFYREHSKYWDPLGPLKKHPFSAIRDMSDEAFINTIHRIPSLETSACYGCHEVLKKMQEGYYVFIKDLINRHLYQIVHEKWVRIVEHELFIEEEEYARYTRRGPTIEGKRFIAKTTPAQAVYMFDNARLILPDPSLSPPKPDTTGPRQNPILINANELELFLPIILPNELIDELQKLPQLSNLYDAEAMGMGSIGIYYKLIKVVATQQNPYYKLMLAYRLHRDDEKSEESIACIDIEIARIDFATIRLFTDIMPLFVTQTTLGSFLNKDPFTVDATRNLNELLLIILYGTPQNLHSCDHLGIPSDKTVYHNNYLFPCIEPFVGLYLLYKKLPSHVFYFNAAYYSHCAQIALTSFLQQKSNEIPQVLAVFLQDHHCVITYSYYETIQKKLRTMASNLSQNPQYITSLEPLSLAYETLVTLINLVTNDSYVDISTLLEDDYSVLHPEILRKMVKKNTGELISRLTHSITRISQLIDNKENEESQKKLKRLMFKLASSYPPSFSRVNQSLINLKFWRNFEQISSENDDLSSLNHFLSIIPSYQHPVFREDRPHYDSTRSDVLTQKIKKIPDPLINNNFFDEYDTQTEIYTLNGAYYLVDETTNSDDLILTILKSIDQKLNEPDFKKYYHCILDNLVSNVIYNPLPPDYLRHVSYRHDFISRYYQDTKFFFTYSTIPFMRWDSDPNTIQEQPHWKFNPNAVIFDPFDTKGNKTFRFLLDMYAHIQNATIIVYTHRHRQLIACYQTMNVENPTSELHFFSKGRNRLIQLHPVQMVKLTEPRHEQKQHDNENGNASFKTIKPITFFGITEKVIGNPGRVEKKKKDKTVLGWRYTAITPPKTPQLAYLCPSDKSHLPSFFIVNKKINSQYQYEDLDINLILNAKIEHELPEQFRQNNTVEVLAAIDNVESESKPNTQLQDIIQAASNNHRNQILLIPCNIGYGHWAGLLLHLSSDNTIVRAEYYDSIPQASREIPEIFKKQLCSLYPTIDVKYCEYLVQDDGSSCGAYMIENLFLGGLQQKDAPTDTNNNKIRSAHLKLLKQYRHEDYVKFKIKQARNNRVADIDTQREYLARSKEKALAPEQEERITALTQEINCVKKAALKQQLIKSLMPSENLSAGEHKQMIAKTMMEEYQNPSIKISDKLKLKNIICTIFKVEWDSTDPCPDLRDTDLRMEYDELSVFAKRITASADASVELPAIINSANLNGCPFTA